jgi:transcriptional regulator GlxA family with amidase domain
LSAKKPDNGATTQLAGNDMNIGIYIYDDAEVLDFSGPFEVFSTAKRVGRMEWDVFFVGKTDSVVKARGNFLVYPHYTFEHHPDIDVLMVVGGNHTREVKNAAVMDWISTVAVSAKWVVSVCTGAFLLAEAGLLNGVNVTTHWEDIPDLRSQYPKLNVIDNQRWVSEDRFITSAGISAGIDMSLFLVAKMASQELAEKTARQMEYNWVKNG